MSRMPPYAPEQIISGLGLQPPTAQPAVGRNGGGEASGDAETEWIENILSGEHLHESTLRLAASLVARGMTGGGTVKHIRSLMDLSTADRDTRFRSRYRDIPRLVREAERDFAPSGERHSIEHGRQQAEALMAAMQTEEDGWPAALDLAALSKTEPQPPDHIMPGVPCGVATGVFGHGGGGKSQIELHKAVCIALGRDFWGLPVARPRKVLYASCEDAASILHFRLANICKFMGVDMAELARKLQIIDLVGTDSVLFSSLNRRESPLTSAYETLRRRVKEYGSEVVILDGISDTYNGGEFNRQEIKQFVNSLLALIPKDGSVIVIGHVNRQTAESGNATSEGYAGSTGWHNSVRSRWYLRPRFKTKDSNAPPDADRIIEVQKANYGKPEDIKIAFHWDDESQLLVGTRFISPAPDNGREPPAKFKPPVGENKKLVLGVLRQALPLSSGTGSISLKQAVNLAAPALVHVLPTHQKDRALAAIKSLIAGGYLIQTGDDIAVNYAGGEA